MEDLGPVEGQVPEVIAGQVLADARDPEGGKPRQALGGPNQALDGPVSIQVLAGQTLAHISTADNQHTASVLDLES
jgi:hypothetical protein